MLLFSVLMLILCTSCWEDVPGGLSTDISGQVTDSIKGKTIEGAKVLLIACNPGLFNDGCSNILDSARTDSEGRFAFNFTTSGKDDAYFVKVEEDNSFILSSTDTVIAGRVNKAKIFVRELNFLKVKIQIESNTVGPIKLITPGGNINIISQDTRDTTVFGKVLPMTTNWFTFEVYDEETGQNNKYRRDTDTLVVDMADTVLYLKKIENPKEWPVR